MRAAVVQVVRNWLPHCACEADLYQSIKLHVSGSSEL